MAIDETKTFTPINIAILTVSDTRTAEDETVTLPQYVERMAEGQDKIYYLAGQELGDEVLLLTDTVDEFAMQALAKFEDHDVQAADAAELEESEEEDHPEKEEYEGVLTFLKTALSGVKEVRLSHRLRESASCLVVEEGGPSANMERIFRAMGRADEVPAAERVLELNPEHPAVKALRRVYESDATDGRVEDYGRLLYDQAVLAEGSKLADPAEFDRRVNRLIENSAEA